MGFSLEKFESYAYGRDQEMAMRELLALLEAIDGNYGGVGAEFHAQPLSSVMVDEVVQHVLTRIASAASCLLSDTTLFFAPEWQSHMLTMHRWLSTLFSASPFRNADHVMRSLNQNIDKSELKQLAITIADLPKFCLLYMGDSEIPLDLDALWAANRVLAASLCLVLISPRYLGSPLAHSKREQILPWLAERLDQVEDIELLPMGVLHDLYMHCSYANRADKHDIKKPINALIRRKLAQQDLIDLPHESKKLDLKKKKPVLLVVLEWFTSSHSIYRTHSLTIEHARRHFHVVGMAYESCVDDITKKVFDEFVAIKAGSIYDQLHQIQAQAKECNAQAFYMPSVGMFPLTMWLANLRIAPLQLMALGHPATTYAHAIDYVVVEEDYVGDAMCFSEKLLKLPVDGMPYRPSLAAENLNTAKEPRKNPDIVKIAMCATTMKLNPLLLATCARIAEKSTVPIRFEFLIGQAQGLVLPSIKREVRNVLGDIAFVHPHQGYESYMEVIADCDMFINPFPFGNTNGIIDTVSAGLVGVCMTGPEVHEHIDEGIFKRLLMPKWLIANTIDEYVDAAVRLAQNHDERNALREKYAGIDKIEIMFRGRPEIFGDLVLGKLKKK